MMRSMQLAALVGMGCVLWPSACGAQVSEAAPPAAVQPEAARGNLGQDNLRLRAPRRLRRKWYGWQTLSADALSLLLVPAFGVGVASFFVATPIIHGVHGRGWAAAVSVAVRVVAVGLPAGLWLHNCFELRLSPYEDTSQRSDSKRTFCEMALPAWFFVGLAGAISLDAVGLAYRPVARASAGQTMLLPWYDAAAGRGGLMLRGTL